MRRYRPKLKAPEPVDAILARAGEDRFAPDRPPIALPLWRTIVGVRVADRTRPVKLEDEVLVIRVATSAWAQELSLLSETILARLAEHGITARRITFRTGPIEPPARPPERRGSTKVPPPAPIPRTIQGSLDAVADDELRGALAAAIAQSLATAEHVFLQDRVSESRPAARGPRSAGPESAPPDRGSPTDRGGNRRTRGGAGGRSP